MTISRMRNWNEGSKRNNFDRSPCRQSSSFFTSVWRLGLTISRNFNCTSHATTTSSSLTRRSVICGRCHLTMNAVMIRLYVPNLFAAIDQCRHIGPHAFKHSKVIGWRLSISRGMSGVCLSVILCLTSSSFVRKDRVVWKVLIVSIIHRILLIAAVMSCNCVKDLNNVDNEELKPPPVENWRRALDGQSFFVI